MSSSQLVLWASELSPFALKLRAVLDASGLRYRSLPTDGGTAENLKFFGRLERAKRARTIIRYGGLQPLDEFPLVPFLMEEADEFRIHYDSSAIAHWLDATGPGPRLCPADGPNEFLVRLIDEAFDEFVLYLVHHRRWSESARTNDAAERLLEECRSVVPRPLRPLGVRFFASRQVRRMPYLFSVGPWTKARAGLPTWRVPPARPGFPSTHALLDSCWEGLVDLLDTLFGQQPFLFGDRFTLADAAVYGQLSMNLTDGATEQTLATRTPSLHRWLCGIRDRNFRTVDDAAINAEALGPLLSFIAGTFVPLMQQNSAAHAACMERGETLFNEPAFDSGRSLYTGELLGHPFRTVVKSFQVRTWNELTERWEQLSPKDKSDIQSLSAELGDALNE